MRLRNTLPLLEENGVNGFYSNEADLEKLAGSEWDSLNIDSLGVYQLALDAEEKYGISIVDEDLDNIRTVGEFADLVNRKIEGK